MRRSKIMEDLLNSITPEEEDKWKQERIERKNKLTHNYQLGFYVGLEIVNSYLPTLSTDMLQTRNVIQVSGKDMLKNIRLNEEWFETTRNGGNWNGKDENGDKEKWDLYHQHNKMLERKYLPNPLICRLSLLNIQNESEFKNGLRDTLWDCDLCSYNIEPENIKIYDDKNMYFTIIEFVL
jgi:hypothetical protein